MDGNYKVPMASFFTTARKYCRQDGGRRVVLRNLFILFFAMSMASIAAAQTGTPWPEADRLFHADPRWLGADGAFSIDLGNGRVLWTFGDTFVARKPGDDRSQAAFVRNTVAIQSGYDPSHATIKFYWRTRGESFSEIFPSEGQSWMWPGSGIRIGDKLLLFSSRMAPDNTKGSLGFKSAGWNAYWVTNPDAEPNIWNLKMATEISDTVIMGSAVVRDGGFIYLFGESEPEHDLYLARLRVATLARGRFGPIQWWSGKDWQTSASGRHPVLLATATEASVQRNPVGSGFIEIYNRGFGATDIVMRRAQKLEGPWSSPQAIYRPPESNAPGAFVYAGKSHAELKGADLIVTYAANGPDEKVLKDMSLYFPRFVKIELHNQKQ